MREIDPQETAGQAIESMKDVSPPSEAGRERGHRLMMAEVERARQAKALAAALPQQQKNLWERFWDIVTQRNIPVYWRRSYQMTAIIVAIIVALVSATGGVVLASDSAAPGDLLYGLDRSIEQVRLDLASEEGEARLHVKFAEERLEEAAHESEDGDDEHEFEALLSFDEALAEIEALLATAELSDELRAALEEQLAALIAAREAFGDRLVEIEVEMDGDELEVEVEIEDASDDGSDDDSSDSSRLPYVEFRGTLESLDATSATISGQTFLLLPGAEIKAGVTVGLFVEYELVTLADGTQAIREIELEGEDSSDDDSSDDAYDDSDSSDDEYDDDSSDDAYDDSDSSDDEYDDDSSDDEPDDDSSDDEPDDESDDEPDDEYDDDEIDD